MFQRFILQKRLGKITILSLIITLLISFNAASGSQGISLFNNQVGSLGGTSIASDNTSIVHNGQAYSVLLIEDHQQIFERATALLQDSINFRLCRLQLQVEDTNIDCSPYTSETTVDLAIEKYYTDFNSGDLLKAYCPTYDFDQLGRCGEGLDNYRNKLIEARRLFASLYLSSMPQERLTVSPSIETESNEIAQLGLQGMLETTRELGYAHMIFGSEFAIDAFDFAFTLEGQSGSEACESAVERYQQSLDRPYEEGAYDYFDDAECIIERELSLLEKSLDQYSYAMEIMTSAYHDDLAWPLQVIIGDLFGQNEIQVFAVAVENYAAIADEIAIRHRQLGDSDRAREIYATTYDELFLLSLPLLERASELYPEADNATQVLLSSNGVAVRSGLELMTNRILEIDNGVNLYGYTEEFVPVQSYFHMRDASIQLFDWATEAEIEALSSTRAFDVNATLLDAEMDQLRGSYIRELNDLCGLPEDGPDNPVDYDFEECVGGPGSLMEKSWFNLAYAMLTMNLADRRIDNALEQIQDIQNRYDDIIKIKLSTGQEIEALTLAQGMARATQVTESTTNANSTETFTEEQVSLQKVTKPGLFTSIPDNLDNVLVGEPVDTGVPGEKIGKAAEIADFAGSILGSVLGGIFGGPAGAKTGSQVGGSAGKLVKELLGAFLGKTESSITESETKGVRHSETTITSVTTTFNQSEIEVAGIETLKQMALLHQDIDILNIEAEVEIRNLIRTIGELQQEKELAANQFNQAVSEHNRLRQQWLFLKAQYRRAQIDLGANYLVNPAYRLLKDHNTEIAQYQLQFAAKQAYLTARALEYQLVDEIPFRDEIFKVRHTDHLRDYLFRLKGVYDTGPTIDETNVEFSLRVLASGIRDQDISNADPAERQVLIDRRNQLFQAYLDEHLILDEQGEPERLVLLFDTSLANRPINSESRWGWRIAGATTGSTDPSIDRCPVRKPYGVSVDILQGEQTLPSGMTVNLKMGGHTSVRQQNRNIVQYSPGIASILPSEDLPRSIREDLAEAVAEATLDVNNPENTISDFCNMSVAASSWILEIPIEENQIDYALFQDIKLKMWTFYFS
ncbi:MAG: hypothetical protein AAF633_20530 [Chloroflexota bacterium]